MRPIVIWFTLQVTNATVVLFYTHCAVTSNLNLTQSGWIPQAGVLENSNRDFNILFKIEQ